MLSEVERNNGKIDFIGSCANNSSFEISDCWFCFIVAGVGMLPVKE
jgi:hypothetical protein